MRKLNVAVNVLNVFEGSFEPDAIRKLSFYLLTYLLTIDL